MGLPRLLLAPDPVRGLVAEGRAAGHLARAALRALAGRDPRRPPETGEDTETVGARARAAPSRGRGAAGGLVALALAGGLAALLAAPGAGAQNLAPGLFAETDAGTATILAFLAGLEIASGTALGEMFFAFNTGMLVLAGLLLVWHLAAALLNTAREGRPGLSTWEIVRITAAIALMAPLPGGLNGAQHLVLRTAQLGGDFATVVWHPFAEEVLARGAPPVPRVSDRAIRAVLARALLVETCATVANGAARAVGEAPYVAIRRDDAGGRQTLHYDGQGRGLPLDLCGAFHFSLPGDDADAARRTAAAGHRRAFEAQLPALRRIAARIAPHYLTGAAGEPYPDIAALLSASGIAGDYVGILDAALAQAASQAERDLARAAAEEAEHAGWLSAASFFNTIAAATALFQAAAHGVPSADLPPPSLAQVAPLADAAIKGIAANLAGNRDWPLPLASAALGPAGGLAAPGAGGGGLFDLIDLEAVTIADSGNPIRDLAAFGQGLIQAALAMLAALGAVAAGSGLLESIPFIGGGLDVFESVWHVGDAFISTLLGLLLIAGVVLAHVLPAIPFLRFLFAILAWLLAVAVACLAVTVFCCAHLRRGDGRGLAAGTAQQGWLALAALAIRPPLMLFGLILGYYVFLAAMGLFNGTWLPQLRDAAGSDGLGPIAYVALLTLYVMTAYALINGAFKLVDLMPSAVLAWIGGQIDGAGGGADRLLAGAAAGAGRLGALRVGRGARARPPGGAAP